MSGFSVPAGRLRTLPSKRTTNSERSFSACLKAGEFRIDHALRDPVVIAQIEEQHAAMVADAMAPARQADRLAVLGEAEGAAGVGAVAMHFVCFFPGGAWLAPRSSGKRAAGKAARPSAPKPCPKEPSS